MSEECHSILHDPRGRRTADVASVSFDFKSGSALPEHLHPEHQLVFASTGVMTIRTGQGIWVVPPLRAVWIPARTRHAITMSGVVSMRTLYFWPRLGRALPPKCFVMNVSPLLRELILHACAVGRLSRRSPPQRRIIEMILDQLHEVRAVPLQLPNPTDLRALRVVETLCADPSDERPLDELCRDSGASRRTVQRLFLRETKMPFARWRQQLRLLRAMQLLASGEKVSAVAAEAGYGSTSAFIAMFRKQLGTTPARYLET